MSTGPTARPRVAPNGNYWRYEYAGLDGVFKPLPVKAAQRPTTQQRELVDVPLRGIIQGAVVGNQPLAAGSLTVLDIQPLPTLPTAYDEIVNGANGFTGTNSTIEKQVDTDLRLVTLRITYDARNIKGGSYYQDCTGTLLRFAASPQEADDGSTWEATVTVYGAVGPQVYIG